MTKYISIDLSHNFYRNVFSCRSFFISEYLLYRSKSCFSARKCTHVSPKRSCRGMFEFFTGNRAQHSHTNCLPGYVASFNLVSHFIYTAHCFDVFHLKKGPTVIRYAKPHGIIWHTIEPMESSVL